MTTPRELSRKLWDTWSAVEATPRITKEPADGRPLRGITTVWQRRSNGRWYPHRNPDHEGVSFKALMVLQLRDIPVGFDITVTPEDPGAPS